MNEIENHFPAVNMSIYRKVLPNM